MSYLLVIRCGLMLALLVISYLAFAPLDHAPLSTGWDKLNHLLAFAVLLLLLDWGFPSLALLRKIQLLLAYGFFIEFVQIFLAYREFSLLDFAADALGLGVYLVCRGRLQYFQPGVRRG